MASRSRKITIRWLAEIHVPEYLALLGVILYLVQAVVYAHIRLPNLDEGSYLYKGYLLATGVYKPFQPYGFWINKMYLAFFIWGWVQSVFAPGLLAPRYFAVFLSILSVLGLWIVSRRLGNRWLAAVAVWVLALNPTLISLYSTARSEVLIIFILTWVLVLSLGAQRPTWQIIASSALTGVMVLTRENMVFVLPLLIIYVFWQHGRKQGFIALSAMLLVLAVGHLIYWPGILYLWERWLPAGLLSLLGQNGGSDIAKLGVELSSDVSLVSRLHSLSQAIRIHYIPFIGSFLVIFLWPRRESWKTPAHFRAAVFLAVLFFMLLASHAWASLGQNYCVYCFKDYIAFWGNTGLILIVVTIGAWNKTPSIFPKLAIIATMIVVTTAIGYALFEKIGSGLLNMPLPRLGGWHILPGWATLWQVLSNKFHIDYWDARAYIPAAAGLMVGILLLIIAAIIYRYNPGRKTIKYTNFIVYGFLILGVFLLPLFAWPYDEPLCKTDVVNAYEQIGAKLAGIAPPGTRMYLDGSITSVPLLYTRDAAILPPQLNDNYSFRIGGDPDMLLRNGFWNKQIGLDWRDKADVFVIADDRISAWQDYLTADKFRRIPLSADLFSCTTDANILLFQRK